MEYDVRVRIAAGAILVALTIGVSAIVATTVASRAYETRGKQAAARDQEITVRGSARQRIRSDLAVWTFKVRGEGKLLADAYTAIDSALARVRKFLLDKGFTESELELAAIETAIHYARDPKTGAELREVASYSLERAITVTSQNVERTSIASGEVTALLKENIQVVSARPAFYYSKLADVRISMAGDAARDAKARADEVASKAGCTVGEVRRVNSGPVQVTPPNSTDVSGSGAYDTTTIDKDISITVSATFGVVNR